MLNSPESASLFETHPCKGNHNARDAHIVHIFGLKVGELIRCWEAGKQTRAREIVKDIEIDEEAVVAPVLDRRNQKLSAWEKLEVHDLIARLEFALCHDFWHTPAPRSVDGA